MADNGSHVTGIQIGNDNNLVVPINIGGEMSRRQTNGADGSHVSLSMRDGLVSSAVSSNSGLPLQIVINVYLVNSKQPVLSEDMPASRVIVPDRRAVCRMNRKRTRSAVEVGDAVVPCKKARH